jgi:hypothetical protein
LTVHLSFELTSFLSTDFRECQVTQTCKISKRPFINVFSNLANPSFNGNL